MKPELDPRQPAVAVGVVVQRGHEILLVQRGKPPHKGAWSIPGGHLKYGETISDAAVREVREECGIEIKLRDVRLVLNRIGRTEHDIQYHFVIIDLLADWLSGDPVAGDDADALRWVHRDQLDKLETSPGLPGYIRGMLRGPGAAAVCDVIDTAD